MTQFPECSREELETMLIERNQELERCVNLLRDSAQYVIAWSYEYADKPNDDHNNAQRDRINKTLREMQAAIADGGTIPCGP